MAHSKVARITVRLPQAEKSAILNDCKSLGITINAYCRMKLSNLTTNPYVPDFYGLSREEKTKPTKKE